MRRLIFLVDVAMVLLAPIVLVAALLVPKRKGSVLLIPRFYRGFHGNIKYIFLYLAQRQRNQLAPIFLTGDSQLVRELEALELPATRILSLKALISIFRAEVVVVEDAAWTRRLHGFALATLRSRKYQLWHGNGIKEVSKSNPSVIRQQRNPFTRMLGTVLYWFPVYDVMVFSSPSQRDVRAKSFSFRESFVNGQPRNDVLGGGWSSKNIECGADKDALEHCRMARQNGRRTVMYCPTWRPDGHLQPYEVLDFNRLNDFAERTDLFILYKPHPKTKVPFEDRTHVRGYAFDKDIYPALSDVDLLITDYSSIYLDFLLTGRPVVFYPYDLEGFVSERGLQRDFMEATPGPKCFDQEHLQDTILQMLGPDDEKWQSRREQINVEFNTYTDYNSCARLYDRIAQDTSSVGQGACRIGPLDQR